MVLSTASLVVVPEVGFDGPALRRCIFPVGVFRERDLQEETVVRIKPLRGGALWGHRLPAARGPRSCAGL